MEMMNKVEREANQVYDKLKKVPDLQGGRQKIRSMDEMEDLLPLNILEHILCIYLSQLHIRQHHSSTCLVYSLCESCVRLWCGCSASAGGVHKEVINRFSNESLTLSQAIRFKKIGKETATIASLEALVHICASHSNIYSYIFAAQSLATCIAYQ